MLLIVCWFSCWQWYHTSLHPQIIWCGSAFLSGTSGCPKDLAGCPPPMARWRKTWWGIQAAFQTNQNAAQWHTWCTSVQCYKEFEIGGSQCGTSAETKTAQEHQKELWITWLSCKKRGRGQKTGNELKHCLHILKAPDDCRAPWLNCCWLNSDRHCWTLAQEVWKWKGGWHNVCLCPGCALIPNRQLVMEDGELQYYAWVLEALSFKSWA